MILKCLVWLWTEDHDFSHVWSCRTQFGFFRQGKLYSLACWKEHIHYLVLIDAKSSCRRKTTENFWTLHVPHLCSLCGVSGTQVLGQPHYWLPGDVKGNKTPFQQETGKLTVWWYFLLYMQLDLCLLLTVAKLSFYAWGLMGFFADIEGYGKNSVANFLQCCLTRRY